MAAKDAFEPRSGHGPANWPEIADRIDSGLLKRVRVAWADQHGVSRCKIVPARGLQDVVEAGMRTNVGTLLGDTAGMIVFDPFTVGGGFNRPEMTGAPDVILRPDLRTFRMLPWSEGTGWVTGDLYFPTGEPLPYSTRGLLCTANESAASLGYEIIVGIEVEFHLTKLLASAGPLSAGEMGAPGSATQVVPTNYGYQHQSEADVDSVDDVLIALQGALEGLGMPVRTMESELGPSQFEFTFDPLPAMQAADLAFLFRVTTKQIAQRHGYHATFMSRPRLPGFFSSGWHLHLSVVGTETPQNLFVPRPGDQVLSRFGRNFTAGILAHARESAVLTTPTVNGYKRFRPNSLAPDRVNWGSDQRGAMIRVSGEEGSPNIHIENRVGEPAANPYLYVAAQIFSGLDGVRLQLEPPPTTDEPYQTETEALPTSLAEAVEIFNSSAFYRDVVGGEFVDFFVAHKRSEASRYAAAEERGQDTDTVSEWEHREYFDLY